MTDLAAASGVVVAPPLLITLWNDGGNRQVTSPAVHGYKRQICRANVLATVEKIVFYPDLYSHLHRGVEHTIYGGPEDDQVPHMHGHPKVQVIDGGGNHVVPRVPVSGHGPGEVNPMHEAATQKGANRGGIGGEDDLGQRGPRIPVGARPPQVLRVVPRLGLAGAV